MSILHAAPAVVESAPSDWSARFDRAQAEFRRRNAKPVVEIKASTDALKTVALVLSPDPLPMLASPIDGTGDMQAPDFYRTFQRTPELSARRLAVVDRHLAEINAQLDARESFASELVNAVAAARPRPKFHPSAEDRAWELGYSLGRDGIAAASYHRTHEETMAFLAGHDRGLTAYHDDQRDEVEAVIAAWEANHALEVHEAELAECGSVVGHMA